MLHPNRGNRGNMIVVSVAFLIGIVMLLIAFGFNYVRMTGGQHIQQSAIQAAALAAAQDLSRIVVDTPEFGYVSLSDSAPIGKHTVAGDTFYLPVHGINTLIGTTRLDYIIGSKMNAQNAGSGNVVCNMAMHDLNLIYTSVVPRLEKVLGAAVQKGGSGTDITGATVTPYADAENAFTENLRRTGSSANTNYKTGSLLLTMGSLEKGQGIVTNIPIPQPISMASVPTAQQQNNYYLSDDNIQYSGYSDQYYHGNAPFVFAAVGPSARLVDNSKFVTDNGLPVQVQGVVKAEADQIISNSQSTGLTVHTVACASPANVYDPLPAPGALSISFPDGQLPDIQSMQDVIKDTSIGSITLASSGRGKSTSALFGDLLSPKGGDYPNPGVRMAEMPWMLAGNPTMADAWMAAFHDWLRRAGTKANIASVLSIQSTPFALPPGFVSSKNWWTLTTTNPNPNGENVTKDAPGPQIPNGFMEVYKFNTDGTVSQTGKPCYPCPYQVLSENQMYAEVVNGNWSGVPVLNFPNPPGKPFGTTVKIHGVSMSGANLKFTQNYDVYLRDEVRQPGDLQGGTHGGEPLENMNVSSLPRMKNQISKDMRRGKCIAFDGGGSGIGCFHLGGIGDGALPLLTVQSDFAEPQAGDVMPPGAGNLYTTYPTTPGGIRPTYTTNGSCVDIRFRRQIDIITYKFDLKTLLYDIPVTQIGYLFFEYDDPKP
jgi:hypothetical protein